MRDWSDYIPRQFTTELHPIPTTNNQATLKFQLVTPTAQSNWIPTSD